MSTYFCLLRPGAEDDGPAAGGQQNGLGDLAEGPAADADMADADTADKEQQHEHEWQQAEQQQPGDEHHGDKHQQHQEQQQEQQDPLHATESDALLQLEEQNSADAAAAVAGAGAARISTANSEAADDNLLSGLADDDDMNDAPKAAGGTLTADAAANATNADLAALPESVKQQMTKYEHDAMAQKLAGKALNARQRRTLNRLIARGQGLDAAAAAKLGLDVNGTDGDEQQQQQHPSQQQQLQQQQQPKVRQYVLGGDLTHHD
jgi:hypothetical protein